MRFQRDMVFLGSRCSRVAGGFIDFAPSARKPATANR
jgi:hypothetical protein